MQKHPKIDLDTIAEFTWGFGQGFLLEVKVDGQSYFYEWLSPDYDGDGTIKPFHGNPGDYTSEGFMGRCKGTHRIEDYCGPDVKFEV